MVSPMNTWSVSLAQIDGLHRILPCFAHHTAAPVPFGWSRTRPSDRTGEPIMRHIVHALCFSLLTAGPALAAGCGNTGSGFDAWKSEFAAEARAAGVGERGINALMGARYSSRTIG